MAQIARNLQVIRTAESWESPKVTQSWYVLSLDEGGEGGQLAQTESATLGDMDADAYMSTLSAI